MFSIIILIILLNLIFFLIKYFAIFYNNFNRQIANYHKKERKHRAVIRGPVEPADYQRLPELPPSKTRHTGSVKERAANNRVQCFAQLL